MRILLVLLFYGFFYVFFENTFNWIQMDIFSSKPLNEKLQLRPSNPASLWHFFSGAIAGLLLYFLFKIPFNMLNVFHIIASCLIGGTIITLIEFGCGYFLFYVLKIKRFWDYSDTKIIMFNKTVKLNFMGLIDIWHSLGWCALTYAFYVVNKVFN